MATLSPVALTAAWSVVYDTTTAGDFVGIIQQVGGSSDAILAIASSAPAAGVGGFTPVGNMPVGLAQSSGLKIYGRSPSASASVIMTTNAGGSSASVPSATITGNVSSGALTQAMGATAIDISAINRSALQIAIETAGVVTAGTLGITVRARGTTSYRTLNDQFGSAISISLASPVITVIGLCNYDSIKVTPTAFDGTSYTVYVSGM